MPDWLALLPRRALMLPVRAYRLLLSPWIGGRCLYEPTCSLYALQALAVTSGDTVAGKAACGTLGIASDALLRPVP